MIFFKRWDNHIKHIYYTADIREVLKHKVAHRQELARDKIRMLKHRSAEDSRAGEAAGVSSNGGVWVMCLLGSVAVPSSVAAGWVADVEEARVEPNRPRSGGRSCLLI
jgi:hypothetical protein